MSPELNSLLLEHFRKEGDFSPEQAATAIECLAKTALNVGVDTTDSVTDAQCFLGFSFGGQHDELLNVSLPGPQNEKIANALCYWYEEKKRLHEGSKPFRLHMCVQWEIVLNSDLPEIVPVDQLHILRPPVNAMSAKHDHYPTQRLWADMVEILFANGIDATQVPVGLFAHRYHLPRIIEYARSIGVMKVASPLTFLPFGFDPHCAYPWTRDFRGFWLSHVVSAMAKWRNELYCVQPQYFPQKR